MGFWSKVKKVGKLAVKVSTAPVRLQAKYAGKILTAASRVGQSSGGARPAVYATPTPWKGASAYSPRLTVTAPPGFTPASSAPAYAPAASSATFAPSSAPASSGDPYAMPGGGGGGGGGGRGAPPPSDDFDGGGYGVEDDGNGDSGEGDAGGDQDDGQLGDIYSEHFGDLAGWKDSLLTLGKAAAAGGLTSGAGLLTAPTVKQIAIAAETAKQAADARKAAGMPVWVKVAIGGAVALPVLYLVARHKGGGAQVAPNPRKTTTPAVRRAARARIEKQYGSTPGSGHYAKGVGDGGWKKALADLKLAIRKKTKKKNPRRRRNPPGYTPAGRRRARGADGRFQ